MKLLKGALYRNVGESLKVLDSDPAAKVLVLPQTAVPIRVKFGKCCS